MLMPSLSILYLLSHVDRANIGMLKHSGTTLLLTSEKEMPKLKG